MNAALTVWLIAAGSQHAVSGRATVYWLDDRALWLCHWHWIPARGQL